MRDSWTTSAELVHVALGSGRRRSALEAALREAIRDGRLAAGARLPSTRALSGDLGVARGTVVEVYAQLETEGYVQARRGAGTWVADLRAVAASPAPRREPATQVPRFSFDPGLPDLTAFPRAAWTNALRRGLGDAPASSLGYGDRRGRSELRAALAGYLARARGVIADPELIVVCAGFVHGLSLISRALQGRGARRVAMEDPCLRWHRLVVSASGLDVVPIPVDERGAQTGPLGSTGADAAILTPAHQFPLGVWLRPDRRAAAIAWARATDGVLVEDDYDAELRYDRRPVGAMQALDPDRVVYAGTTSKTLAPGLRLGWLVLPSPLVEPVIALRELEDVHVPASEQIAFTELLTSGVFERHIRRMRNRYRVRRRRLLDVLAERAPRVTPRGISGGLRVLLQLPAGAPPASAIVERGNRAGMRLFPLIECYHDQRGARDDCLLIGYSALPDHAFESGIDALMELLASTIPA
jgi:GntR family transcriptional regulator/MocR family aminotransferase